MWHHNIDYKNQYSYISKPYIYDIDQDGRFEIVYSFENRLFAVDGENGKFLWEFKLVEYIFIKSGFDDFDNDGNSELIIQSLHVMYLINCENGMKAWDFAVDDNKYKALTFKGTDDINDDGSLELIFIDLTKIIFYL